MAHRAEDFHAMTHGYETDARTPWWAGVGSAPARHGVRIVGRQNVTSTLTTPPLAAGAGTTLPFSCVPSTLTVRSPVRVMWMR